jgi:single-strand DNA-binding protein
MAAVAKSSARGGKHPVGPVLVEHRNEVAIVGRLSKPAEARELPSGDQVVVWRLVVDRPDGGPRRSFDAIDCTAFAARVRRSALAWKPGATIEAAGALRRRFWRGNAGLASTYEVHVTSATKLSD